jgi:transposase-like protein
MDAHVGYAKHDPAGRNGENSGNGSRSKTVFTGVGPVKFDVPGDRDGSFEPEIVRKCQRRLDGVDEVVLSLSARGLTHREIVAHLDEVYGAKVSKDTITAITDKIIGELAEWQSRRLDRVYPVVLVDAIHVKIRDGQVANRLIYTAVGVSVVQVLTEIAVVAVSTCWSWCVTASRASPTPSVRCGLRRSCRPVCCS